MENRLVSNFAQHQSSKAIWESLATIYGSGADPFLQYDLEIRANKVNQGEKSLEDYWSELQKVWMCIDRSNSNPIDCCEKGIRQYQTIVGQSRLYQFLSSLDLKFDSIWREVLKETPTPTAESAFAHVRREATRLKIFQSATQPEPEPSDSIGSGLSTKSKASHNRPNQVRQKLDKSKLICTHCGKRKHTREMCSELVGYPEWWEDNHKPPAQGKAAVGLDSNSEPPATHITAGFGGVSLKRAEGGETGRGGRPMKEEKGGGTITAGFGGVSLKQAEGGEAGRGGRPVKEEKGGEASRVGSTVERDGRDAAMEEYSGGYSDEGDYWTWH